jgi:hypothetical protein
MTTRSTDKDKRAMNPTRLFYAGLGRIKSAFAGGEKMYWPSAMQP